MKQDNGQGNTTVGHWLGSRWAVILAMSLCGWGGVGLGAGVAAEPPPPPPPPPPGKGGSVGVGEGRGAAETLPKPVREFVAAKDRQLRTFAAGLKLELPPEVEEYLRAAQEGDWRRALGVYADVKDAAGRHDDDSEEEQRLWAMVSGVTLELQLAFELFLERGLDQAMPMGETLMASVPSGAVLFGGTDEGRGLPTVLSRAHAKGDPFFTLTQNALADGRYVRYLREIYAQQLELPGRLDTEGAFRDYVSDAQRRAEHDQANPGEPRQLKPGEDVRLQGNRVTVSGQVAVMGINARLARLIFDRNPGRTFLVEESFPLDWMYPHLTPHGVVMKLNAEPLERISDEAVAKDSAFWAGRLERWLGASAAGVTSVADALALVRRLHIDRNLGGFGGDPAFLRAPEARKVWGRWRAAIGGLYAWRAREARPGREMRGKPGAVESSEVERMSRAADRALREAFLVSPDTTEPALRYARFLEESGRTPEALRVLDLAVELNPGGDGLAEYAARLRGGKPRPDPAR